MSSLKFGTSGLRGLVEELQGLAAYSYARAFCAMINEDGATGPEGQVLIGRDLRSSSPGIADQCAQGVSDAGLVPIDAGEVPTPALALIAMKMGAPAIMVTGSHIPDDRNGLKFYRSQGEIDKSDETRIHIWQTRLALTALPLITAPMKKVSALAEYRDRYLAFFKPDCLSGMTVGVYQHSSVGRDVIGQVISALGAEVVPLGRSDRFVPVDTEALRPEDQLAVSGWAADRHYDAIVSADGDADRPLIADEAGQFLRGDLVGALTAVFLGANTIVTPVTSNSALEGCGRFQRVVRTKVGSPFVIAGLAEARATRGGVAVGFEANGGTLLGTNVSQGGRFLAALPTRDAVLPILAVLSLKATSGKPLSLLAAELGFAVALSNRLHNVPQANSFAFIELLSDQDTTCSKSAFERHGGIVDRDRRDGLRLSLEDGSTVHFRASGNAPELRVYVEADNLKMAETLLIEGMQFARLWSASSR